jgi:hypothetical protein
MDQPSAVQLVHAPRLDGGVPYAYASIVPPGRWSRSRYRCRWYARHSSQVPGGNHAKPGCRSGRPTHTHVMPGAYGIPGRPVTDGDSEANMLRAETPLCVALA